MLYIFGTYVLLEGIYMLRTRDTKRMWLWVIALVITLVLTAAN